MAEYLKIPEVAQRLDVSEKTARRMVKGGKLPSVFIGGAYRVSEEDLKRYLEAARVRPGDGSGKAQASAPPEESGQIEELNHCAERLAQAIASEDFVPLWRSSPEFANRLFQLQDLLDKRIAKMPEPEFPTEDPGMGQEWVRFGVDYVRNFVGASDADLEEIRRYAEEEQRRRSRA